MLAYLLANATDSFYSQKTGKPSCKKKVTTMSSMTSEEASGAKHPHWQSLSTCAQPYNPCHINGPTSRPLCWYLKKHLTEKTPNTLALRLRTLESTQSWGRQHPRVPLYFWKPQQPIAISLPLKFLETAASQYTATHHLQNFQCLTDMLRFAEIKKPKSVFS